MYMMTSLLLLKSCHPKGLVGNGEFAKNFRCLLMDLTSSLPAFRLILVLRFIPPIAAALLLGIPCLMAEDSASEWQGYRKQDFTVDGRAAVLVFPVKPAPGNPWIWRTEFFGHEPQADLALLAKGFHVAFIDLQNMYGGPAAMGHMDKFFDELTSTHQLASKVVLEGFSRGGLFALNWAALHPEKISSIYLDAPVCDFKSWPAGFGKGPGSAGDWVQCKEAYGFASDDEAKAYRSNPVDRLEPLAKARIPLLIVYGEADEVVPVEENTEIVAARYRELGGEVELIGKPGGGHHPHSLQDPQRIVEFVLKNFAR